MYEKYNFTDQQIQLCKELMSDEYYAFWSNFVSTSLGYDSTDWSGVIAFDPNYTPSMSGNVMKIPALNLSTGDTGYFRSLLTKARAFFRETASLGNVPGIAGHAVFAVAGAGKIGENAHVNDVELRIEVLRDDGDARESTSEIDRLGEGYTLGSTGNAFFGNAVVRII